MIDHEILMAKVSYIEKNISHLESINKIKEVEFLESPFFTGAAKYYLQTCIEAMLDIAHHIIARERYRAPINYVDSFRVLGEKGILQTSNLEAFYQMARFRNRVVHLYHEVDDKEVYKILQNSLIDFKLFIKDITSTFL